MGFGQPPREPGNPKSEIRNPKEGRNPNPEKAARQSSDVELSVAYVAGRRIPYSKSRRRQSALHLMRQ
jgi:hypothetical protein